MPPNAVMAEAKSDDWQPKVDINKQLHKTKLCKHGSECSYAHYQDEKRSLPDLRKTRVCKQFGQGKCSVANCPFAHGLEELRGTEGVWKTVLCSKWQQGSCRVGKRCRFAHGFDELRAPEGCRIDGAPEPQDYAFANAALRQYAAAAAAQQMGGLVPGGLPVTGAAGPAGIPLVPAAAEVS